MIRALFSYIRNDFSELSPSIKVMGLMVAFKYVGIGLIDPFFALYLGTLTSNYTSIGALVSFIGLVSLFVLIPFSRLADHVRMTDVVWHGLQGYALVALLYFFAGIYRSLPLLFVGLFIHGVSVVMVDTGSEVYIRRHAPDHRASEAFGYLDSIRYLGWVLGIVAGGLLFPYFGFSGIFLAMVPCMLVNSFFVRWIHEEHARSLLAYTRRLLTHFRDFFGLFGDLHRFGHRVYFLYLITFFDGLVQILAFTFIPLFARSLSLSYGEIAFLMAVMYIPSIFSFFFAEIADRFNKLDLIVGGLSLAVFTFGLFFLAVDRLWVVLLSGMISLAMAFVRPAYNGLLSDLAPKGMLGEVSSIQNFIIRIAVMLCPLFFGAIADLYSIRFVFLFTAIVAFCLVLVSVVMKGYFYIVER